MKPENIQDKMPRKRKSLSASPKRRVSITDIPSSLAGLPRLPAMNNNREDVFTNMCEMFPNLDPSLVEMVLSEYKEVEIVMDYLLELSTSAKGNSKESTGFAKVASFLDDFQIESQDPEFFQDVPDQIDGQETASYMGESVCNDLDTLLDEALDKYGLNNAEPLQCEDIALLHDIVKPELDQTASIHNTSFHTNQSKADLHREGDVGGLDPDFVTTEYKIDMGDPETSESADVETGCKTGTDPIFSSPNCSAYGPTNSQEKLGSIQKPTEVDQQRSGPTSATSNVKPPKCEIKWNPMASSFYPISNMNPSFITPVAVNPIQWPCVAGRTEPGAGVCYNSPPPSFVWNFNNFSPTHWNTQHVKPINKTPSTLQGSKKVTPFVGKVLVLLRGAPGCGKSTLARLLLEQNPTGVILSTDDYFCLNGEYQFDVSCLGEAHEWNYKRAKDAFEKKVSPIIIDNTNLQGWEMKPYVSLAMKHKYKVTFREPDTWWKYKPKELERRNRHGVKKEKIIKMLENFERVTVNSILNLSYPKASKNADNSQRKTDEKNGKLNVAQSLKEEETALTKSPESESIEDIYSASPAEQKCLEVSKDGLELLPDIAKSSITNVTPTEGEDHIVQPINTDNEVQGSDEATADNSELDKQGSDLESVSSLPNVRPELLSFVGDWPVEQTMSQRTPRTRKARTRPEKQNPSVQKSGENDKTADTGALPIDKAIEEVANRSSEQEAAALYLDPAIESSTVNYGEENVLGLENQFNITLTLHDKEGCAEEDDNPEAMAMDKIFDIAECTDGVDSNGTSSVNEKVKRKPRQHRRSCRQCKLALNFTNNCSSSSNNEESECSQQPAVRPCQCSQTEPQDFALAWRIERKNVEVLDSAKILVGRSSRFVSKSMDGGSDAQENIPYRMMHHKSTFVEEDDIISLGDQDSLEILCKLFRSLSFDILKDFFERCGKDIDWTTNLLLDSGEKMHKDEEGQDLESSSQSDKENAQDHTSVITEEKSDLIADVDLGKVETESTNGSLKDSECSPFVNALPLIVAEELKNGNVLSSNEMNLSHPSRISSELEEIFLHPETITDTIASDLMWPSDLESDHPRAHDSSFHILPRGDTLKTIQGNTEDIRLNNANLDKKSDVHHPDLLVGENNKKQEILEDPVVAEEEKKMQNQSKSKSQSKESLQFNYLELALPPEFAFQLTELFGPVGIDPGSLTIDDCVVPIDLKLAESIHKKWKESIMERHRQEALSYQLIFQDPLPDNTLDLDNVTEKSESGVSQKDTDLFPFMDQWNTRVKRVSLRQIIAEEMALQAHQDSKKSVSSKNCAVKMKEKQLLELFPNVEPQLLLDIFEENNYSLEKTEQFMSSVLEADPVQNVIAQGFKQAVSNVTEKNKEKKLRPDKETVNERDFQDLEYPNYDDFRAEAFLYHQKQKESFRKAAEAHTRGMKQVAAYYAQQGYLYGQKMKEENRRAAVHIFERANEYLLPENILDLHGLHVDEAMKHFRKVLQDKADEFKQNGGKPHLLVITGRGNHSQGGIPRIKPAVIDFLTNHDYRFQEKTPGVLRVTLK
ncbi:NEDD4-binding protein 2 [Leptodactylus fuscus]|uniref:NEDD4-binding protein 2 n=1 Tax=Leptodactylus fuscus TaxID=238119 RepID=UPI003F4F2C23